MSTTSRHSYASPKGGSSQPRRALSRVAAHTDVSYDDAYSYALRVAFLNYLLQPRKKRKEYVSQPKQPVRSNTVGMLGEVFGLGEAHAPSMKLPSAFRIQLEKRLSGVVTGKEHMAGYSDALLRRTFAEAYTTFTEKNFQKSVDKDRKVEPLFLMFYTAATKALGRGKDPGDKSWTFMVDRHTAMFLRLLVSVLRDHGADRDRPELVQRLTTLESKLLTSDQNLLDTGQGENKFIEVEIPLTYEIKDMHMVQVVAKIFGVSNSKAQADIDANKAFWTEEAAVKDLKQYQTRLSSNMAGTLRRDDFDLDAAFDEWKKNESHLLGQIFTEILSVRPELRGTSSALPATEKPLPTRPQSMFAGEQAYAEIGKMLAKPDAGGYGFDQPSLAGLSLEDATSIRSVDEPNYTFIPPEPRAFYKKILYYTMLYESLQYDPAEPYTPLGEQSTEVLIELSVRWRLPQFTRYVAFTEVAVRMFRDQELTVHQLDFALESLKNPPAEMKKVPPIQSYTVALTDLDSSRWAITDFAAYQHALGDAHVALLRDLYDALARCYEPKPPSIKDLMMVLGRHIYDDPAFSQRPEDAENFRQHLDNALRDRAAEVYRGYVDSIIPENQEEWDFSHVVQLGKAVTSICQRIKKRYKSNAEILGVSPYDILVQTMFPTFEEDASEFISRVLVVAKERGEPVNKNDGFELYKELVEIRHAHLSDAKLKGRPFAFNVEGLLEDFVWRHIRDADEQMEVLIDNAIKQDQFQLVSGRPDGFVEDSARHSTSVVDVFSLFNQTLKSVEDLKWQDPIHVARFKKALSKSFAAGIGRYCEVVESRFAKEMDRQMTQEVTATTKTAQEKFLQYAKDALTAKEKIEPFHFYTESFVKLNNIEFAMQALDKLEHEMNVSECAELLRRVEPKQQAKRPNKYIFTIKVVEGEDLKACDPNGYSDPYVVLCDEYQKRLLKTQVKYSTLNPHWNESFDITVSSPLNIIATIWDWDRMGDHDFVGRTSLKLDPVHFSDYLPREFWLELDTQGRLLIRVSMEGERDDIEFYFGKAFRHLKRAERDMVRKITDKLTAHINASLSRQALKNLVGGSLTASVTSLWKKRQSTIPPATAHAAVEQSLQPLFEYFQENFRIMNVTLTSNTMQAVMTRIWKEVLITIENLLVPPLSEQPSAQKPLTQAELDVVFKWLGLLFEFFNDQGQGVPAEVLKSPKWQELQSLNFFYFETTEDLIRTSETMAAANAQKVRQQHQLAAAHGGNRLSAPASLGGGQATHSFSAAGFGSLGTIRRGRSIMMSRNLGTMRQAKEDRRKEAREDASDDLILRILRMRPEAARYLLDRQRQKTRQESQAAAQAIVRQSAQQGWNSGQPAFGGALYGRNHLPRR